MKLLLTSAGITNKTIADTLATLAGKDANKIKIGFIPTAANVEEGNKDWFITQFTDLQKHGFNWIDVIDISSPEVNWQERLSAVDVIYMSGGNTFHLLDQVRKTKFDTWLQENLDSKVYVGVSAGTIIATPDIGIASIDDGDINYIGITDLIGMSLVDFEISVHTPESVSHEGNKKYLETIKNDLYALDNNSAILVTDNNTEVISEGEWIKY